MRLVFVFTLALFLAVVDGWSFRVRAMRYDFERILGVCGNPSHQFALGCSADYRTFRRYEDVVLGHDGRLRSKFQSDTIPFFDGKVQTPNKPAAHGRLHGQFHQPSPYNFVAVQDCDKRTIFYQQTDITGKRVRMDGERKLLQLLSTWTADHGNNYTASERAREVSLSVHEHPEKRQPKKREQAWGL